MSAGSAIAVDAAQPQPFLLRPRKKFSPQLAQGCAHNGSHGVRLGRRNDEQTLEHSQVAGAPATHVCAATSGNDDPLWRSTVPA
jgi:hypothetical protein